MNNYFKLTGLVRIIHSDKEGNLKEDTGWLTNTVVTVGKAEVGKLLASVSGRSPFKWLAVGDSTTAVAVADTLLASEITTAGLERAVATITQTTTTVANDSINFYKLFTATGTKTVNEIGIFNTSTANTAILLGRKITGAKALLSSETLSCHYKIIIA